MKRVILNYPDYPDKPKTDEEQWCDAKGNPDQEAFEMALFAWKEGYKCGKQRQHVARECPQKVDEQDQMHANKKGGVVNEKWILLDSQSTVNQVSNPAMLTSIRKAKNPSTIHCNAGSTRSMCEGELFGK